MDFFCSSTHFFLTACDCDLKLMGDSGPHHGKKLVVCEGLNQFNFRVTYFITHPSSKFCLCGTMHVVVNIVFYFLLSFI